MGLGLKSRVLDNHVICRKLYMTCFDALCNFVLCRRIFEDGNSELTLRMTRHDRLTCGWFSGTVFALFLVLTFVVCGCIEIIDGRRHERRGIQLAVVFLISGIAGTLFLAGLLLVALLRTQYSCMRIHVSDIELF